MTYAIAIQDHKGRQRWQPALPDGRLMWYGLDLLASSGLSGYFDTAPSPLCQDPFLVRSRAKAERLARKWAEKEWKARHVDTLHFYAQHEYCVEYRNLMGDSSWQPASPDGSSLWDVHSFFGSRREFISKPQMMAYRVFYPSRAKAEKVSRKRLGHNHSG